ncbi:MAG: NHL repeat-containing protein [Actinomycetes bacterium]|jgi:DNA-binding beta-propeller fold protein YncE|nr:NHL repeat-containing protein [Actinomycetes bacterium]
MDRDVLILPRDIVHQRITWALAVVFAALSALAVLLLLLVSDVIIPGGFEGNPPARYAYFLENVYEGGDQLLSRPSGVAVSPRGELYVADTGNARIAVFDNGNFVRELRDFDLADTEPEESDADGEGITDTGGKPPRDFETPASLAFASDGRWFVVDISQGLLLAFDEDDICLWSMAFEEEGPVSVKVNVDEARGGEFLYVTTKSGIVVGSLDGDFDRAWMNWGRGEGQLDNPAAALTFVPSKDEAEGEGAELSGEAGQATDGGGSVGTSTRASTRASGPALLLVCDSLNYRVQAYQSFDSSPTLRWVFGAPPSVDAPLNSEDSDRKFGLPVDLALSNRGKLFVLDGLSSEIVVLNAADGSYAYTLSDAGSDNGMLFYPEALCWSKGRIYVADKFNDRVVVFEDIDESAPLEPPVTPKASFNRWLLMLPFALAMLAALVRAVTIRQRRYILDDSFIEALRVNDELRMFVIDNLREICVPTGSETLLAALALPGVTLRIEAFDEATVFELLGEEPRLTEREAAALLVAQKNARRAYLLTASWVLATFAHEKSIAVVTLGEMKVMLSDIARSKQRVDLEALYEESDDKLYEESEGDDLWDAYDDDEEISFL